MSYLKSKDGSIEASIKEMQKNLKDNAYQQMFKKELEKAGKGIGSMSDMEKKDFFNKIDKKYKGKNEAKVSEITKAQEKLPPALQKAIKAKEKNEDLDKGDEKTIKPIIKQLKKSVTAHDKQAKTLEKDIADEKKESLEHTIWSMAAKDLEEMKKNSKYMKAQDVSPDNDTDSEKDEKKGKTLVGSKATKVETEPKVDYVK